MEDFKEKQEKILFKSRMWLIAGIVLIIITPFVFIIRKYWDLSLAETGTIGDTVGGLTSPILGLVGSVLVYYAFLIQLEANKMLFNQIHEEKVEREKSHIESHFFELLKIHIEIQNNIKINDIKNQNILQGREVFQWLLREFYEYFEMIDDYFLEHEKEISIKKKLDMAYTCFLFGGVGEYSFSFIQERLENQGEYFLNWIKEKFEKRKKKIQKNYPFKLFNGHHSRIGHYYNHLYQTIKYINSRSSDILSYEEKYDYIKTLRAQLSTHEQSLLFFVSLTEKGLQWEKARHLNPNKHLITKYNLIKDIPKGYITITSPENHYPNIKWNHTFDNTPEKKQLIERYT